MVHDRVQGGGVHEAPFHQKGFERLHPQGDIRRRLLLMVVPVVMVVMGVRHGRHVGATRPPGEERA